MLIYKIEEFNEEKQHEELPIEAEGIDKEGE